MPLSVLLTSRRVSCTTASTPVRALNKQLLLSRGQRAMASHPSHTSAT
jgi:hypothetical protein